VSELVSLWTAFSEGWDSVFRESYVGMIEILWSEFHTIYQNLREEGCAAASQGVP
jgi:hypothetical protein